MLTFVIIIPVFCSIYIIYLYSSKHTFWFDSFEISYKNNHAFQTVY